jgi:Spy/CpxP family protein refolding chaperone
MFSSIVERAIRPNEEQRDPVMKILERHSGTMAALAETFRETMARTTDSVQSELRPYLTPEQQRRLKERLEPRMIGGPHLGRPEQVMDRMKDQLSLNAQQVGELQAIDSESRRETEHLLETHQGDLESVHDSLGAIMRGREARIKSLLTPEQQKKYEEIRKERQVFGPGGFPPPDSGRE